MCDEYVVKQDRNALRRNYLKIEFYKIENSISNIKIQCLFDNKSWKCTVVFIIEVLILNMSEKCWKFRDDILIANFWMKNKSHIMKLKDREKFWHCF